MKIKINLDNITFIKFVVYFFTPYRDLVMIYLIFAVGVFAFADLRVFRYLWIYYQGMFFLGLILSYIIHEYAHIYLLKMKYTGQVSLEFSLSRISIIPEFQINRNWLVMIAIIGPIVCGLIGGIILFVNKFLNHLFLDVMAYIYFLHIVNLLPPFGDGNMILKALINSDRKGVGKID